VITVTFGFIARTALASFLVGLAIGIVVGLAS
jgi:hypothetical protein